LPSFPCHTTSPEVITIFRMSLFVAAIARVR
jgi:hypothetical protein